MEGVKKKRQGEKEGKGKLGGKKEVKKRRIGREGNNEEKRNGEGGEAKLE